MHWVQRVKTTIVEDTRHSPNPHDTRGEKREPDGNRVDDVNRRDPRLLEVQGVEQLAIAGRERAPRDDEREERGHVGHDARDHRRVLRENARVLVDPATTSHPSAHLDFPGLIDGLT